MNNISLRAPAKVNLRLEVFGKRPDGFHEIKTWICPISLADEVTLEQTNEPTVTVSSSDPDLPSGRDNLAHRAAALFLEETGINRGIKIHILKRIPVAAGLGGGSSDAAAVLRGMNMLWETNLSQERLMEVGAVLGSDVPFFVLGRSAVMGGRGERLVALLPPVQTWMVVINPGVPLSTQKVYETGGWGLTKPGRDTKIVVYPQDREKLRHFLRNDLERPAIWLMPVIDKAKRCLRGVGAHGTLMAGSGPSVFGLFPGQKEARQAVRSLTMEGGWVPYVARTIVKPLAGWGVVKR